MNLSITHEQFKALCKGETVHMPCTPEVNLALQDIGFDAMGKAVLEAMAASEQPSTEEWKPLHKRCWTNHGITARCPHRPENCAVLHDVNNPHVA